MAPHYDDDDDWSDSDEDEGSGVETSVQLGIPDGPLESDSDRLDAAVSRIGGHPVRYHSLLRACTLILIQCHFFAILFVVCRLSDRALVGILDKS